jgi:hypothetical protein
MRTRQIPRAEWPLFFDGFNRRHEGWLATVRVLTPTLGAQVEVQDLPFEGIVADPEVSSLSLHLGKSAGSHVEHPVERPLQVWLELTDDGADSALEIESENGVKTILQFRSALLPEMVDGLAR